MANPFATETELLILRLLRDGPGAMYGLQLVEASALQLKRVSVYVTLGRLEDRGFVESHTTKPPQCGGFPRPLYRITAPGLRALADAEERTLPGTGSESWELGIPKGG